MRTKRVRHLRYFATPRKDVSNCFLFSGKMATSSSISKGQCCTLTSWCEYFISFLTLYFLLLAFTVSQNTCPRFPLDFAFFLFSFLAIINRLVPQIVFLINLHIILWRHPPRGLHFGVVILNPYCIYVIFPDYFPVLLAFRDPIHALYMTAPV